MNRNNFESAMKAALKGPTVKKIKFEDHEFNVKKVSIGGNRATGTVVKGVIDHHLSLRDDDHVSYQFQLIAGSRVTIEQVKIDVDGSFMNQVINDIVGSLWDAFKDWLVSKGKEEVGLDTKELATRPDEAQEQIFRDAQSLLDGSWMGEVKFMIVNIAGRLAIQTAQAVYRETNPGPKPPKVPTKPKLPPTLPPSKPGQPPRHVP